MNNTWLHKAKLCGNLPLCISCSLSAAAVSSPRQIHSSLLPQEKKKKSLLVSLAYIPSGSPRDLCMFRAGGSILHWLSSPERARAPFC